VKALSLTVRFVFAAATAAFVAVGQWPVGLVFAVAAVATAIPFREA
jgi:hypothetical protein